MSKPTPARLQGAAVAFILIGALSLPLTIARTVGDLRYLKRATAVAGTVTGTTKHRLYGSLMCVIRTDSGREFVLGPLGGGKNRSPACPEGRVQLVYDPNDPQGTAAYSDPRLFRDALAFSLSGGLLLLGLWLRWMRI